jgi:DNA-binding NarL/FixJ family response regulator
MPEETQVNTANDNGAAQPARILIVDDHPMVRAGLKAMLNDPEIEVVGEAADGRKAIALAIALQPDVVLMDLNMPDMDGLEATAQIKKQCPAAAVVIITGDHSRNYIRKAIDAGAAGYIMKGAERSMLLQAVKLVRAGGSLIDAGLLSALAADANEEAGEAGRRGVEDLLATLSPRELEVVRYLARGLTNKEIAQAMHYSVGTVKNVVQRIIEKLGVSDRTQAAVYAVRAGLDLNGSE